MPRALIGLLPVLLWGCGEDNMYVPPPPPTVSVSQPVQEAVTDTIETSGNIQASNSVNLVARVEGYLQSVDFTDGTFVKKGDLLFVIEPEPYEAQVRLQEATVAQQQATLVQASEEYARQQRLIQQNATSQAQVESWRAQQGTAQAAVDEANANLELAEINLGYTRIVAPSMAGSAATWSTPATWLAPARRPSSPRSSSWRRSTSTSTSTRAMCCGCAPACAQPAGRWPTWAR